MRCALTLAVVQSMTCSAFHQPVADPREGAVQAALLDSLFTVDTTRQIVVGDSTVSGGTHYVDEDYRSALTRLGLLPDGLQADFEARRPVRRAVDSLPTRVPMRRFGEGDEHRQYNEGRDLRAYWSAFYGRFPGSSGRVQLSRVGFSRDGATALVLVEYACGALCGGTIYAVLARTPGRWRVVRTAQPRIA